MGVQPDLPESDESKSRIMENLRRECAAIQQISLCNEEQERKLTRQYAGSISQGLISGYDIRSAITDRLIELVKSEVTTMLNLAPALKHMFVGPNASDNPGGLSETKVNGMMADLDWVYMGRLLASDPFGGYAWDDAETNALREKVFETESELRKMGALFKERKRLAEILSDFLMQYGPFPQDQSPVWEEHSILVPCNM